jgi:hypothetical protein
MRALLFLLCFATPVWAAPLSLEDSKGGTLPPDGAVRSVKEPEPIDPSWNPPKEAPVREKSPSILQYGSPEDY